VAIGLYEDRNINTWYCKNSYNCSSRWLRNGFI
jgi:hypothetical protein